jgi:hypothetical protein
MIDGDGWSRLRALSMGSPGDSPTSRSSSAEFVSHGYKKLSRELT